MNTVPSKPEPSTNGSSSNGSVRLPKASDYKLPKRLSADRKRAIEATQAVLEGFKRFRSEEKAPAK